MKAKKLLLSLLTTICLGFFALTITSCDLFTSESIDVVTPSEDSSTPDGSETNQPVTEGLEFTLSDDGESYSVAGIGTATDTDIVIPSTYNDKPVTSIDEGAFVGCISLTSITIPDSVTSIGSNAFGSCGSLESIVIDKNNTVYDSRNNCNAIIETSINTLVAGCKNTIIPDSITSIGEGAFVGCISLTSITIPDSVTSIGMGVFQECDSLKSVNIPDGVSIISDWLFQECESLENIYLPDSIISIGEFAFSGCISLTNINIPNNVTRIGYNAFSGCSLTSITIPDSVTSIGSNAFGSCDSLESIVIDKNNTVYDSRNNCNAIIETSTNKLIGGCKNTLIPNSVKSIGNGAFSECSLLKSIIIPSSVTSIEYMAFYGCFSLETIYYTGSIYQWHEIQGLSDCDLYAKSIVYNYVPE